MSEAEASGISGAIDAPAPTDPTISEGESRVKSNDSAKQGKLSADPSEPRDGESYEDYMARMRGQKPPKDEEAKESESQEEESSEEGAEEDEENASAPKVIKLKVNGEEIDFDISDDVAVKEALQKGLAATERFERASKIQKQANAFIEALKKDPVAILEDERLGINFEEVAEQYIYKKIIERKKAAGLISKEDLEEMEARERYDKDLKELARLREEKAAQQKAEQERRLQAEQEKYRETYQNLMINAMDVTGVPKTAWTVHRMAHHLKNEVRRGNEKLDLETVTAVANLVRDEFISQGGTLTGTGLKKQQEDAARRAKERSPYKENKSPPPKVEQAPRRKSGNWRDFL